ncbi:hypothetical protein XELAEV_18046504mg [Xenopus laevis]|uniref:Uncharacterized protein n=1 Tax=Xenopus laevis TaxID=8355 RepID=A0A974BTM3_XENLA|nr:hypothetical protein XELAEV_18046504mg [Xenopus laevis]
MQKMLAKHSPSSCWALILLQGSCPYSSYGENAFLKGAQFNAWAKWMISTSPIKGKGKSTKSPFKGIPPVVSNHFSYRKPHCWKKKTAELTNRNIHNSPLEHVAQESGACAGFSVICSSLDNGSHTCITAINQLSKSILKFDYCKMDSMRIGLALFQSFLDNRCLDNGSHMCNDITVYVLLFCIDIILKKKTESYGILFPLSHQKSHFVLNTFHRL